LPVFAFRLPGGGQLAPLASSSVAPLTVTFYATNFQHDVWFEPWLVSSELYSWFHFHQSRSRWQVYFIETLNTATIWLERTSVL